jgi:alginate O-acetyltransferase complex protein AlgI
MPVTSLLFVFFTGFSLAVYHLLPRRPQNIWLLFVSYVFLARWDWRFAVFLGVITVVNFALASRLRGSDPGRRAVLWIGIGFNILVLVIFRTVNFFIPEMEKLFERAGFLTPADGLQMLIPLGVSFYVLQAISYLVDVYRGQVKIEPGFLDFALYLAYFPKIVAGPIERPGLFLSKLAHPRSVDRYLAERSVVLIFTGLVRKLLIADLLWSFILSDVFEIPTKYTPPEMMIWLIIYAFALYNDFAGYTQIVRGVSGFFGIELSPNFRTPYFSRSFNEFWTRWHISLSEWLRDYVYFPVSRALSRRSPGRQDLASLVMPPMITMLVSGLWHGFGLHMVIWGGLHGLYLILERLLSLRWSAVRGESRPLWRQGLAMGFVFTMILLAWVPFGWEMPNAFRVWEALTSISSFDIRYQRLFIALPILLISLAMDLIHYHSQDEYFYLKWPRLAQAACMAAILILVFIATGGDFKEPFVYQAF